MNAPLDPRTLTDAVFAIASGATQLETSEAIYQADRDRAHAHFDLHHRAGLIAAGLIDAPVARTQESF